MSGNDDWYKITIEKTGSDNSDDLLGTILFAVFVVGGTLIAISMFISSKTGLTQDQAANLVFGPLIIYGIWRFVRWLRS